MKYQLDKLPKKLEGEQETCSIDVNLHLKFEDLHEQVVKGYYDYDDEDWFVDMSFDGSGFGHRKLQDAFYEDCELQGWSYLEPNTFKMETLYYDIKGKFDENERRRNLFYIAICSDKIISFASADNTICDLSDLQKIINFIDKSKFFYLMASNQKPLENFHIGGNFRLVLNKNKSKKLK